MNKKYMRDIKMYALSKGLEVMIKPIVDARTGASRTTFLPRDADKWKESYSNIVLNLLDSTDFTDSAATGIVIGCELDRIMQRRPDVFNDLALAIRARGYKGTLIYATAYGGSDDEDNIMAASKLDAELGVDFYVPNHSWYAEENRKMMSYAPDGRMCLKDTLVSTGSIELASHLERIWNIAKKPFRITEFGHRSFDMGYSCYVYSVPGRENSWVQFKCYSNITEAFEAAAQRGVRINSAAVWNTSKYNYIADLKTTSGTGFPFVSRPAGEVVRKYNQRHNSLKHELHARNNL